MVGSWFRINVLTEAYGISKDAAEKYRSRGIWTYGHHYKKDPVGRYVYSREAIESWLNS